MGNKVDGGEILIPFLPAFAKPTWKLLPRGLTPEIDTVCECERSFDEWNDWLTDVEYRRWNDEFRPGLDIATGTK